MLLGKVVGNVWATQKQETLEGLRFLLVQPANQTLDSKSDLIVAADPIGAGIGEWVIVAFGRAARNTIGRGHGIAYQTAVVAIVDKFTLGDKDYEVS
ncbi:MAG: ethanolamine utilization protein EutN [Planctomycetota bacterium]|nr:MAG: ethanolamine utilization protein EutN [Planctomycetota bacterium]